MRTLLLPSFILIFFSFDSVQKRGAKLPSEFEKVPAGTFYISDTARRVAIGEFFISRYEVTNLQYRVFFEEASAIMTAEEKQVIACDTAAWETVANSAPMKKFYFSHPSMNEYPVVNVSYEGARQYCQWLQQKLQKDNPGFDIIVRLPSREEWMWAAMGGRTHAIFPWKNYYLRDNKGRALCNFRKVNDGAIHRNRTTGKPEVWEGDRSGQSIFTSSVKSFSPNDFGLYNMCGNAAEMINEKGICVGGSWNDYGGDVNNYAKSTYEKPSPTIGFRPIIIVKQKEPDSK